MPPAKKPASRRRAPARKRSAAKKEPAAIQRLNKSLDAAQDALAALRKDVSRGVGAGSRDLHKNLQRFITEARRDSGRLSKAIERDVQGLQKRISRSSPTKASPRAGSRRKVAGRSTAKRTTSRTATRRKAAGRSTARRTTAGRPTARRTTAGRSTARRTTSRTASRSRAR